MCFGIYDYRCQRTLSDDRSCFNKISNKLFRPMCKRMIKAGSKSRTQAGFSNVNLNFDAVKVYIHNQHLPNSNIQQTIKYEGKGNLTSSSILERRV